MADDRDARIAQLEAELSQARELHAAQVASLREENASLRAEAERRDRALDEALEQQTATAEILRVIAESPTDAQPVLDTLLQSAVRLSHSARALLLLRDGDQVEYVAVYGVGEKDYSIGERRPITPDTQTGRAILERRVIHIPDRSDPALLAAYPGWRITLPIATLVVPLLRDGEAIGALALSRDRAVPFSPREVALVETFADQAVIAIENARLFEELERRNADLAEALDQQAATAQVLRTIASSPTDLQAVLESLTETMTHLCDAGGGNVQRIDGDLLTPIALYPADLRQAVEERRADGWRGTPITPGSFSGRALLEGRTVHAPDVVQAMAAEYADSREVYRALGFTYRTLITTPLLSRGEAIGILTMHRQEQRPFTEQQIRLLETFADQAVIAIENARLFEALRGRVEELQALGEVGQAISSSLDLPTVLATIVANATRLSGADSGIVYEYDEADGVFVLRASHQTPDDLAAALQAAHLRLGEGVVGRAGAARAP